MLWLVNSAWRVQILTWENNIKVDLKGIGEGWTVFICVSMRFSGDKHEGGCLGSCSHHPVDVGSKLL
jgi:hypothetical protein